MSHVGTEAARNEFRVIGEVGRERIDELGPRFRNALGFAAILHRDQPRKGGKIPYIGHLLGVAATVIEEGGSEDEIIAALLHDALEDQPERTSYQDIIEQFGERVADLVVECSDLDEDLGRSGTSWDRKQRYLAKLPYESRGALKISLADKLYNARAVLLDLSRAVDKRDFWNRFNVDKEGQIRYYRGLVEAFESAENFNADLRPLLEEFRYTVERLAMASNQ